MRVHKVVLGRRLSSSRRLEIQDLTDLYRALPSSRNTYPSVPLR